MEHSKILLSVEINFLGQMGFMKFHKRKHKSSVTRNNLCLRLEISSTSDIFDNNSDYRCSSNFEISDDFSSTSIYTPVPPPAFQYSSKA